MTSNPGDTPAIDEGNKVKRTRNRRSNNCVPCRQRKKQCDRRVPGCSQCRLRNEVHLCRWGDERDDDLPAAKRSRIEETKIPLRSYTVEDSSDLLDTLSRADTDASPASAPLFTQSANVPARHVQSSNSLTHRDSTLSLTSNQARHLSYCFQEHASKAFTLIDKEVILNALDAHEVVQDVKKDKADVYALILVICASTLILLPPTLSISFGLITRSSEMRKLIDKWGKEAFDSLNDMNIFHSPTLIGTQCMAIHQMNLAFLYSGRMHVRRTDELIRSCRRMGLDQLGSPQDDEDIWTRQGNQSTTATQSGYWAADTLARRDRKARNEGRALWTFCYAKDWACSRLSGSCGIHPLSYTTSTPQVYTSGPSGVTAEDAMVWRYISSASIITYDFFNLCIQAQASGSKLDYDKILLLDARLMSELDSRPDWLKPEMGSTMERGGPHMYDAILVSCTFWQRLFALHRPFLTLSRSEPEKYGLSSSRSYHYALLCIRFMREGLQQGILMLKQLAFHHRLLQAALVVITHLFLSNDLDMHETISIHQELNFAITAIKELDIADDEGYFHGQGERLETLLAISARIKLDNKGSQDYRKCHLRDRSRWRDEGSRSSIDGIDLESPSQEDLFTHLDDQLMKLSQAWPQGPEEMNLDSIWQDVLSLLDPNATT